MAFPWFLPAAAALAPVALMLVACLLAPLGSPRAGSTDRLWRGFLGASGLALALTVVAAVIGPNALPWPGVLHDTAFGQWLGVLVQLLGTVIAAFSARYLQGEAGQHRYVAALAAVLAAVHLLLLADHWLVLIGAWALVGVALQRLLCFYPERPFARLAAHKKRLADRAADVLLVAAATLAWVDVGSGSLSALSAHIDHSGMSAALQGSAIALVLAVVLRTALLPVHGWLIQVMEAPTPVSALLHAGVVNLGGFVLIRLAPLLEHALPARALLLGLGLATAVLAGMVMLTRISIKVRLAWSTVAQMGFLLVECALGLYTLAALHLLGHSLYKAHAFLSASDVVRQTRLRRLHRATPPTLGSLVMAPALAVGLVMGMGMATGHAPWPWWWSAVLGLAWAPLLWLPSTARPLRQRAVQALAGVAMVAALTALAWVAHILPLGLTDSPQQGLGVIALMGMAALYLGLAWLQHRPQALSGWRRWSYAGFYVDEAYTRLTLWLWPTDWAPQAASSLPRPQPAADAVDSDLAPEHP